MTSTWSNDRHGLFDYTTSENVKKFTSVLNGARYLVRREKMEGNVVLMSEEEKKKTVNDSDSVLLKISPLENHKEAYKVESCDKAGVYGNTIDKVWLLVKDLKYDSKRVWIVFIKSRDIDFLDGQY